MLTSPDQDSELKSVNQTIHGVIAESLSVGCFAEPATFTPEVLSPKYSEDSPQSKRRKFSTTKEDEDNYTKDEELEVEENQGLGVAEESARRQRKERFLGIQLPETLYPKSAYQEYESAAPIVEREKTVLQNILVRSLG